jgi:membrane-bound metal-dependent hydrolase YbcI (DUF457 family)
MLSKTHLSVGFANALYFLPFVTNKLIFFPIALFASILPDIDTPLSKVGNKKILRPLQWLFSHRGFIHSYSFCILISLLFALYIPVLAFPFFLGYSFHLFLDSFTIDGIRAFYPSNKTYNGPVRVGGSIENVILISMIVVDFALLVHLFI